MRILFIFFLASFFISCSSPEDKSPYDKYDGTNNSNDSDISESTDDIEDNDPGTDESDGQTDQADNYTDIEEENDSDIEIIPSDHDFTNDPCTPNPCIMENSDGTCYFSEDRFKCGCVDNYFWDGEKCSEDPCADNPCSEVENSTGTCEIDENTYKCVCENGYYWAEDECLEIPDIVYVDASATGLNDGTSWKNAFTEFSDALESVDQTETEKWIWVAKGIYRPKKALRIHSLEPCEGDYCYNFTMIDKVSIICGFNGDETKLDERDWENNESIFSGDLDKTGTFSENDSYNIFLNFNINEAAVMDGCYIEGGNACYIDGTVKDHHAKHGGGMHNISNAHPIIRNTTFRNNYAYIQGAGMMNGDNSNPTIINCHFENNDAFKGAALSNTLSSPTIINSTFVNNIAFEGYGGAVFNLEESSPQFKDCTFIGNTADDGGAVVNSDRCAPVFKDCVFKNNVAERNGGAVGNGYQSKGRYENCLFEGNTSKLGAGAMEIYYESSPVVLNSIFINNGVTDESEGSDGGGILISDSDPLIVNSLFVGNYSLSMGGAIANRNSQTDFLNNTIVFNSASTFGGGIHSETSSSIAITNNIIYYNTARSGRDNISTDFAEAFFYNNNIQGSFSNGKWNDKYGSDEEGNIDSAPMFTSMADGDFTLTEDSFCIDVGLNSPYETGEYAEDITTDLLGHDRIIDGTVDLGAYETLLLSEGLHLMDKGF